MTTTSATTSATTRQFSQRLEPLACAAVVLRGRVGASEDVVGLVSSFLDFAIPERWSIDRACEEGFGLRMLKRLAAHEANDEASRSTPPKDPFFRAYLASKGLIAAIRRADDVDVVRWICCEYCPSVVPVHAMVEAAAHGRLRVLQWLFDKYPSVRLSHNLASKAIDRGHSDVLRWIFARVAVSVEQVEGLLCAAATRGHLTIIRWLHEHQREAGVKPDLKGLPFTLSVLGQAIVNGHFEVTKYLADIGYMLHKVDRTQVLGCAAHGNLEMIRWLHAHQLTRDTAGWINAAAAAGHLHIVKWAHENFPGDSCSTEAMDNAAKNGHLEVVQWLHANRTEGCTVLAMDLAAANGHLEVLQWLHANRIEGCSAWAMDWAASSDHLEIVQWLHENRSEGCTTSAMDRAASHGHLGMVQWLHNNRAEGCTTSAMNFAAAGGRLNVVKWLHENRNEGCTTDAMDLAAIKDQLQVVEWLHENRTEGCTMHAMNSTNSVQMLRWLLDNRTEGLTSVATLNAMRSGGFEKLLFLNENGIDQCTSLTATDVAMSNNFEMFQWLRANYPDHAGIAPLNQSNSAVFPYGFSWEWKMFFEFELGRGV